MPGDIDLSRAHVRAFVARARVDCDHVLEYQCPRYWAELDATDDPAVRLCGQCREQVYLVTGEPELSRRAERGECVAVILPQEIPESAYFVLPEDGGYQTQMRLGRPLLRGRGQSDE